MTEESEGKIIQNLKDAGCDEQCISDIMAAWENGRTEQVLRLLSSHRAELLNRFHKSKNCIDCLDYLVFQIEKEQTKINRQEASS